MDTKTMTGNENLDPLSGEPGAHPVGTGVGATIGGVIAGAAAGSVVGPVGTIIGAAIGATLGGLAGKGVAENIDPTREEAHWREFYRSRPYVTPAARFEDYGPAYSYGVHAYGLYPPQRFEDVEAELAHNWDAMRGKSDLSWEQARAATRDAWQRLSDLDHARDLAGDLVRSIPQAHPRALPPL